MKRRKRFLAAIMAAVMSMTLAACGGGASTSGGTTAAGSTEASTTKAAADSKATAEGGKTVITLWHAMGGVNGEATEALVKAFNESQNEIELKSEYQGTYDDLITKLKAAMQSGNMPDVCQMYDIGTKFMTDSGYAIPVQDMFASTNFDPSTVMNIITSYYTVDGNRCPCRLTFPLQCCTTTRTFLKLPA
jgi:sn-glycerol 3-phosphate transport system substrate-binding protein